MTIAHTDTNAGRVVSGSPAELDLRRRLREAREEARALREQEAALREHLEQLAGHLRVSEHLRVEMHVAYVELLARARAEVAEQRDGTPFRHGHLAGHLEEIGLEPPAGASPDRLVAEGLAVAARLGGGERDPGPHSAAPHSAVAGPGGGRPVKASGRAPRRAGAREGNGAAAQPQPHTSGVSETGPGRVAGPGAAVAGVRDVRR